jgi:hypothetical protein
MQALNNGFGLAQHLRKPKPPRAKPKPGLSGQAGPEHHYCHANSDGPHNQVLGFWVSKFLETWKPTKTSENPKKILPNC